jgi:hypothetical protein
MDDGIVASIILGICFWGFVSIIKTIFEYRILNKLAEKSKAEINISDFNLPDFSSPIHNLKWGIIIFLGGFGLVLLHFLDLNSDSPLPYGIESAFIASGFILYFFIEKNSNAKSKNVQL